MNENARLDVLRRYEILDTPEEPAFDHIVEVVARVLSVPISLVTFVDEDRIWFKSRHGMDDRQIERQPGFCASAIQQDKPWVIEDAATDNRCNQHRWVTGETGVRFYVGIPLTTPEGCCLGSLCAIDTKPRHLKDADIDTLQALAALIVDKLVSRLASRSAVWEKNVAVGVAGELASQSRLLTAMVESSQDAIVTKNLNGRVTSWNAAAERLFGYSQAEMMGQNLYRLFPADRYSEEEFVLGTIAQGKKVEHYETIRLHKSGRLIPVALTVSPIWDERGQVIGASKIARDITDRKSSQDRINALMREVNHRVKNQYAVILSMLRQTSRTTKTQEEFETRISQRILALSRSHDLLVGADWRGTTISDLITAQIEPFRERARVAMDGPAILLSPSAAQYIGMAIHELASNAARYGAMSGHGGEIAINWTTEVRGAASWLHLTWNEKDGPDVIELAGAGFGQIVLRRVTPEAVNGQGRIETHTGNLIWTLDAPLSGLAGNSGS